MNDRKSKNQLRVTIDGDRLSIPGVAVTHSTVDKLVSRKKRLLMIMALSGDIQSV